MSWPERKPNPEDGTCLHLGRRVLECDSVDPQHHRSANEEPPAERGTLDEDWLTHWRSLPDGMLQAFKVDEHHALLVAKTKDL